MKLNAVSRTVRNVTPQSKNGLHWGDGTTKRDVSVKSQLIKKLAGAAKNDTTD